MVFGARPAAVPHGAAELKINKTSPLHDTTAIINFVFFSLSLSHTFLYGRELFLETPAVEKSCLATSFPTHFYEGKKKNLSGIKSFMQDAVREGRGGVPRIWHTRSPPNRCCKMGQTR